MRRMDWLAGIGVVVAVLAAVVASCDDEAAAPAVPTTTDPVAVPPPAAGASTVPLAAADAGTVTTSTVTTTTRPGPTVPAGTEAPPVTPPTLPRRLAIVGDSQAHSLTINLPEDVAGAFTITEGSIDGCSVQTDGRVRSARTSFRRSFDDCAGWERTWARAAERGDAQVSLVVLGGWDLFDVEVDGRLIPFASPEADARFTDGMRRGIDALAATGSRVALLEVPCMRPQDVKGAGVPPLPERGEDWRVAHLNDLLRGLAAADPERVTFVAGPVQWCTDPEISTNLGYRWDGVHVYKPGAKLIIDTITPALLAIPV